MVTFIRKLQGYVRVRAHSEFMPRFINICKMKKIELWDMDKQECDAIFCVSLKNVWQLKDICKRTNTSIHIFSRIGFPFWLKKARHRKGFLVGLFVFCFGVYFFAGFVWSVEIIGNRQLTKQEFEKFTYANNIYAGIPKVKLDAQKFEKSLYDSFSYLTWVCVKEEGTKLCVYVKESDENTNGEQININPPTDLVASDDGMIDSIITRKGTAQVQVGDEVTRGQILISGIVPVQNDDETIKNYQVYHADGDINLLFDIPYRDELDKINNKIIVESPKDYYYTLLLGNHAIQIGKKKQTGVNIVTLEECVWKSPKNPMLPFCYVVKHTIMPYHKEPFQYTKQSAKKQLQENYNLYEKSLKQKGIQILVKDVKIVENDKKIIYQGLLHIKKPGGVRCKSNLSNKEE